MSNFTLAQTWQKYETQRKERQQKRIVFQKRILALRQTFNYHPTHNINSRDQQALKQQETYPTTQHISDDHLRQKSQRLHKTIQQQRPQKNEDTFKKELVHQQKIRQNRTFHSQIAREEVLSSAIVHQKDIQMLLIENKELLNQATELQIGQKDRLTDFKRIIQQIKDKYIAQFQKMKKSSDQRTNMLQKKVKELQLQVLKIRIQMQEASKKNESLQKANRTLESQIIEGNKAMGKQISQIKQSYAKKIEEVQNIFSSSNAKIQSFEKQLNEDQLVENTICNEQFLQNMEVSAKQAEKAQALLEEYQNLIGGKKEILDEIYINNEMKQAQLSKLSAIEKRMTDLAGRLKEDKDILMSQNEKISLQLGQIKKLMVGTV